MTELHRQRPATPVIVGVGQWTRHPHLAAESPEPAAMMAEVLRRAAADAGPADRLLHRATALWTVALTSWPYTEPARTVADLLDTSPGHLSTSPVGGEQPQVLVARAARMIAAGEHDVVLIAGAEAFRSRRLAKATGTHLSWTRSGKTIKDRGFPLELVDAEPTHPVERVAGAEIPLDYYSLVENAFRADGRTIDDQRSDLGLMWHRFALAASRNSHAWSAEVPSPNDITTVSASNKMIRFPYTKLLTANIWVDMAAAVIVCSAGTARAMGIPTDRWVFPLAAADSHDHWFFTERDQLNRSPAIAANARSAIAEAGLALSEIAHVDVYSCFPSAVQVAAREIPLPLDDPAFPLTQTGGLTFAGGPGSNYATHGLAALVDTLRRDEGTAGMLTANGMFLTKHALGLYSTTPPEHGFRSTSPQAWVDAQPRRSIAAEDYSGAAVLETYTVVHDPSDGRSVRAILVARTSDGRRIWDSSDQPDLLLALESEELLGARCAAHRGRLQVLGR